jgi:hypothetical protein
LGLLLAPQLAEISTFRGDSAISKFYIAKSYSNFLQKWSSLPELAFSARHKQLQQLQRIHELEEFHEIVDFVRNFRSAESAKRLIKEWRTRYEFNEKPEIIILLLLGIHHQNMTMLLFGTPWFTNE